MEPIVIIRYGEISLKSKPVKIHFKNKLINNIKNKLKNQNNKIIKKPGRIFVKTQNHKKIAKKISNLPGIVSTSPSWKTTSEIKKIKKQTVKKTLKNIQKKGTFSVNVHRIGEQEYSSKDIEEKIGEKILGELPSLTVDLENPDHEIGIEIRHKDAFIFFETIKGIGGLPAGTQGKVIIPSTGDYKELVAAYELLKRGVIPHFLLIKNQSDNEEKKNIKKILKYHPEMKHTIIKYDKIDQFIQKNISEDLKHFYHKLVIKKIGAELIKKTDAVAQASCENITEIKDTGLTLLKKTENGLKTTTLHPLILKSDKQIKKILRKRIIPDSKKTPINDNKFYKRPKKTKINKLELKKELIGLIKRTINNSKTQTIRD